MLRTIFLPKNHPELKFSARGKFPGEEQNGEPLTLLLADDCTEVDDEEYFQTLGEKHDFYCQEHFYFIVDNPVNVLGQHSCQKIYLIIDN